MARNPAARPPDDDLRSIADSMAEQSRAYLTTVTEVAAGANPEAALPLLLLAVSDLLAEGARLGATTDVVPAERFEPDVGPDPDVEPLRAGLANAFEGIDEYAEVIDPLLGAEVGSATVSGDLVAIAGALAQGLRHHERGGVLEALWWWQFSYLSDWGERASSTLRTIQVILAHLRLDVADDVATEAEYDALQP
ncbi:MAG: DUF5063 domain-containing protein [Cellulomonas sp.]|uniref:DUF5063 domain-containing protein n=1 Tax=Cellulomonas gelida TaxID=1712 RepID=A0A4Y3KPR1_9CELL|nr:MULTISPECIES: DUF5063 domain-containing protein [Cellulomonas]KMM45934.1 hypothetical protein CWIS_08120 [Cellulomonas sp. A375-1]MCR6648705.1 DUF5063 domain-containing protein [Cellulomonas sp.]MCR6704663.1 DUF5063 domain-containing protein [Cellulomonas sp.]GEA85937.1 DUF5063 domain-containing protein [Cellulomonas gelida]GGL33650.1 DUF5063 domain-containing protein [Cellulomonas gelida]